MTLTDQTKPLINGFSKCASTRNDKQQQTVGEKAMSKWPNTQDVYTDAFKSNEGVECAFLDQQRNACQQWRR